MEARRFKLLALIGSMPSTSQAGIQDKATALLMDEMFCGDHRLGEIAESLARDILNESTKDAKLVALGAKFEPLLDQYYAAHRGWSHGGKKDRGGIVWPKLTKALVAFWEISPLCKGDTLYSFDDAHPFQVLFSAVADYCGLAGKVASTGYKLPEIGHGQGDDNAGEDA
jgi:hypothetical protein